MNRFSNHVRKMNEASVNLIPFVPVVKQISTIGEAHGQQSKRWKAGTIQWIHFQSIPVFLAPFLLYRFKEQTKPCDPWEMPLVRAAAENSLSTVAMAENMNPSHCHTGSLVIPSGRTESTSPQPHRTLGKHQISALKSLFHPKGKKVKDLGSSYIFFNLTSR